MDNTTIASLQAILIFGELPKTNEGLFAPHCAHYAYGLFGVF